MDCNNMLTFIWFSVQSYYLINDLLTIVELLAFTYEFKAFSFLLAKLFRFDVSNSASFSLSS